MMLRTATLSTVALVIGFLIGIAGQPVTTASPENDDRRDVTAVRVIDGDTIVAGPIALPAAEWRVRLASIDTPEVGEPGGGEASDVLRNMIEGADVRIEHSQEPFRLGVYGRLVAYVWFKREGEWVLSNAEMVRNGWSRHWTQYGRGPHAALLDELEAEAREERRGAWGMEPRPWPIWPENINTVRLEWLEEIPGVGRVTARRIIAFREDQGHIQDLDELREAGIGRRMVERLREWLTTE